MPKVSHTSSKNTPTVAEPPGLSVLSLHLCAATAEAVVISLSPFRTESQPGLETVRSLQSEPQSAVGSSQGSCPAAGTKPRRAAPAEEGERERGGEKKEE